MEALSFLIDPNLLSLHGFAAQFIQLSAIFAGLRALIPKKVIEIAKGRPLRIVNFSQAEQSTIYGGSPALAEFREFLPGGQENSDQILTCYHSITGNVKVNEELGKWGTRGTEATPAHYVRQGKGDWKSDLAVERHQLGCPTEEGDTFRRKPFPEDQISVVLMALGNRYGYHPHTDWPIRGAKIQSLANSDDERFTAEFFCNFFESRCKSDQEKTAAIFAIVHASKTINIFRLKNRTHNDVVNIPVHVGTKAFKSGDVIESAARAESFEIVAKTPFYTHLIARSIPAGSSRFLIIETFGRPLETDDLKVEAGFTTKFGPSTFRRIAAFAFVICLALAIITYNAPHTVNKASQEGQPASSRAISRRM